jgi:hypothetical protein
MWMYPYCRCVTIDRVLTPGTVSRGCLHVLTPGTTGMGLFTHTHTRYSRHGAVAHHFGLPLSARTHECRVALGVDAVNVRGRAAHTVLCACVFSSAHARAWRACTSCMRASAYRPVRVSRRSPIGFAQQFDDVEVPRPDGQVQRIKPQLCAQSRMRARSRTLNRMWARCWELRHLPSAFGCQPFARSGTSRRRRGPRPRRPSGQ